MLLREFLLLLHRCRRTELTLSLSLSLATSTGFSSPFWVPNIHSVPAAMDSLFACTQRPAKIHRVKLSMAGRCSTCCCLLLLLQSGEMAEKIKSLNRD